MSLWTLAGDTHVKQRHRAEMASTSSVGTTDPRDDQPPCHGSKAAILESTSSSYQILAVIIKSLESIIHLFSLHFLTN